MNGLLRLVLLESLLMKEVVVGSYWYDKERLATAKLPG
jgi:hypothetical protein